jgi:hypothetical protein
MAVTLAVDDTLEAKFFCRQDTQNGINVIHYRVTAVAGGSLTDTQVVALLSARVANLYRALMSASSSYEGVRLQRVRPLPQPVAVVSTVALGVGTAGGSNLPSQAAYLISKRSNLAGRANRGRTYLPFISDVFNAASGVPNAGGLAAANDWAVAMLQSFTLVVGAATVTLAPMIYNRGTGGSVFMVGFTIRAKWATQRRRSEINRGDQVGP